MRWMWIDRIIDFEPDTRLVAVKNVSLAEEHLHDHFPASGDVDALPVMPASLMIEGMAQTAGILVGEARGFSENVILAKIKSAEFTDYAGPGDQLRYDAVIETVDERAAVTSGTILKNGIPIGSVNLIFSHVNQSDKAGEMPDHNFVFTDQFLELLQTFRAGGAARDAETPQP